MKEVFVYELSVTLLKNTKLQRDGVNPLSVQKLFGNSPIIWYDYLLRSMIFQIHMLLAADIFIMRQNYKISTNHVQKSVHLTVSYFRHAVSYF